MNDVEQVTEIDREAFSTQWPPPNYRRELQNGLSHHVVAVDDSITPGIEQEGDDSGTGILVTIARWLGFSRKNIEPGKEHIIGFAGLWIIADEAHITSIAVRESHRGRKVGGLLLAALCDLGAQLTAHSITLEVRVSNKIAQNLYSKFGFKEVGVRRGYYTDNREDAVLMSTDNPCSVPFQERLDELKKDYLRTSKQILREKALSGNL